MRLSFILFFVKIFLANSLLKLFSAILETSVFTLRLNERRNQPSQPRKIPQNIGKLWMRFSFIELILFKTLFLRYRRIFSDPLDFLLERRFPTDPLQIITTTSHRIWFNLFNHLVSALMATNFLEDGSSAPFFKLVRLLVIR